MVNSEAFAKRIEEICAHFDLSAAAFAQEIGVQRSSISHLLSGRNKPSLDFILKVTQRFPEVDLYWLLNGKGRFPFSPGTIEEPSEEPIDKLAGVGDKEIQKVLVFYKDGTFDTHYPSRKEG
ncbi:helix-turn-helix transcriptional regulator [Robiginitalea sediminis]|uniref:helix-turn-helix transcriptional regulator n=1 Tax=Robiginitalea sediminis TaxID=1982593 RepID=UPI000B4BB78C|nr:helix-turn-helix transcriptional regulator [Robiginitalea sediminis]